MENFWLCFVALFVAVDALGTLPIFISLTEGLETEKIKKIVSQSVITATMVSFMFIFFGKELLHLLGVSISDFMIAGGAVLFIISIGDIVSTLNKQRNIEPDSMGAVPLGVPLIAGPAVLTTSIILLGNYGFISTSIALILNILIAGVVFWIAEYIYGILGNAGAKIISKLASLFLAAIAIMIIRKGIYGLL